MRHPIHNIHVDRLEPLVTPAELKAELPGTDAHYDTVGDARDVISAILRGEDPRLLVIAGPCSIHDVDAAMEYAQRLAALRRELLDNLYIVMRVYFEKPRTTIGWKGLVVDPHLDGTEDMQQGLRLARKLLLEITDLGLPTATELLDPIRPQYLAELISWSAIGARTTESQVHRELASGCSMPVGFKNGTDGGLTVALNAIESARNPHAFLGIDQDGRTSMVYTNGNPDVHVVLRGGEDGPNYDPAFIERASELLREAGEPERLVVDCSHGQTNKDHRKQPQVFGSLVEQRANGTDIIRGAMLESNLHEGNQTLTESLQYGVSITDACIDWETTERALRDGAALLASGGH